MPDEIIDEKNIEIQRQAYKSTLIQLENFLDFAIDVSDAISGVKTAPGEWFKITASQLFTRLTVNCMSIIRLSPWNQIFPVNYDFWDYYSVMSLSRNLIENYHVFYFFCIQEIDSEERSFRRLVMRYHDNYEKFKMYKDADIPEAELDDFITNLPRAQQEIERHPFFDRIPREYKKRIIKGEDSMYLSNRQISDMLPFNTKYFRSTYRLFSNQTHTLPMSFIRMDNDRGRGQETSVELNYIRMSLDLCTLYLTAAVIDMTKLFPDRRRLLNQHKLQVIESHLTNYGQ